MLIMNVVSTSEIWERLQNVFHYFQLKEHRGNKKNTHTHTKDTKHENNNNGKATATAIAMARIHIIIV